MTRWPWFVMPRLSSNWERRFKRPLATTGTKLGKVMNSDNEAADDPRPPFAVGLGASRQGLASQIINDGSRSDGGKCLWTANDGLEVLPPMCWHPYEKTLSSPNSPFFSHWSRGVLIFFPLFSSKASVRRDGGFGNSQKKAFYSPAPLFTFLAAILATRLADANQKDAKKKPPYRTIYHLFLYRSRPPPLPHHQTKRSVFDSQHFISSLPPLATPLPPTSSPPSCSPPQSSTLQTSQQLSLWVYVRRSFHFLHKLF